MKALRTWIIAALSLTILTFTLIAHTPMQTHHDVASSIAATTTILSPDGPPPWEP